MSFNMAARILSYIWFQEIKDIYIKADANGVIENEYSIIYYLNRGSKEIA